MRERKDRNKADWYNWEIIDSAGKDYEMRQLTQGQQMILVALCNYLGWSTRWQNAPSKDELEAFRDQLIYDILTEVDCMNCEELTACLQPLFDMVQEQVDATKTLLDTMAATAAQNAATAPEPISAVTGDCYQWGAAYAVFDAMDTRIKQEYARAETSGADDKLEWWQSMIQGLPIINELPYDDMLGMVNAFFENQVTDYETDVPFARDPASGDLVCRVIANGGEFTFEIWGEWLAGILTVIDNHATQVFHRFAPASQTFLNQIAAFFNKNQTLQDWFDSLYQAYFVGLDTCATVPVGYSCAAVEPELGIYDDACTPGDTSGDNLAFDSGSGIWEADGTIDTTTDTMRITLRRLGGGLFKFNTFTSSVGIGGADWVTSDNVCHGGAGLFPPVDTNLYGMTIVIQNTGTPLHIGFNIYE